MIKIICDSTSDFELAEVEALNVGIVSLSVTFGEESFIDKVTINNTEFFDRLRTSEVLPVTSLRGPEAFIEEFAKYPQEEIIAILVSSKVSGTFNAANIAKNELKKQKIYLVDSGNATGGLNLLVRLACQYRDSGMSAEAIVARLQELSERLVLFACFDTLKYLVKGGRLSSTSGVIGGMLAIKPLIHFACGVIENVGKARGMKAGIQAIVERVATERDESLPMIAIYSYDRENLTALLAELGEATPLCSVGSVIGTHCGPGAVGVAYFKKLN